MSDSNTLHVWKIDYDKRAQRKRSIQGKKKRRERRLLCDDCGYYGIRRVDNPPLPWKILPRGYCYGRCERCHGIFQISTQEWHREQERVDPQRGGRLGRERGWKIGSRKAKTYETANDLRIES